MNTTIGILLLLTYFGFIYYAVKGGNIMVGYFVMAILWTVIGLVPFNVAITAVFSKPVEAYGGTAVVIIFGSWFGRVLVETGIAEAISKKTLAIGGNKPVLAAILVCISTTFIFTSAFGVGSVIAIGVIILPILFSLGIPKNIAVSAFTMAIGAGMYLNIVLFKQMQLFFPSVAYNSTYIKFGVAAAVVQVIVLIIMLMFNSKKIVKVKEDKEVSDTAAKKVKKVPAISYIVPILPIIMTIAFKWQPIPSLLLATLLGLLLTGNFKTWNGSLEVINKTIKESVSDIAVLLIMLFALTMFSAAAALDAQKFTTILSAIIPHTTWVIGIAIALLAPLALFRGPLNVWGAGSATAAILAATHIFPAMFLFPLLYIPAISMAISTCPTQSWNLWSINYSKISIKTFLKTGFGWCWITVIINEIIAIVMFG